MSARLLEIAVSASLLAAACWCAGEDRRMVEVTFVTTQGDAAGEIKPADLKLSDKGKEQIVTGVWKATSGKPAAKLPPHTFSNRTGAEKTQNLTVVFLDGVNTEWRNDASAREELARALGRIEPEERVAILVFSKSPRILSDFSDDAATRAAKVKQFGAGSETADPAYKDLIRSTNLTGRAEMYEEQQRLTSTYNTLQSVAGMLKPVAGRKNLLWISGDFPFLLGRPEERAFGLGRSSDAARDADTDFQRTAKIGYNKAADDLVRALNLAGVAVYPVDARKLSLDPLRRQSHVNSITTSGAGEAGTINDIMKYLAHQTGGAAFSGGKELGDDVRGALDDLKRVWFLAFEPANPAEDGAFHSIKLQIQKKGYQVRTRVGYYAPDAATTLADPKQRLTTALASTLDLTGIGMTVRVQADPADSSSLTVSLDLDARDFQLVQQGENWLGVLGLAVVQGNAAGEQFGRQVQLGGVTIPGSSFEKAMRDGSGVHFDFKMKREPTASFLRFVVLDQRTPRTGSISVVL